MTIYIVSRIENDEHVNIAAFSSKESLSEFLKSKINDLDNEMLQDFRKNYFIEAFNEKERISLPIDCYV